MAPGIPTRVIGVCAGLTAFAIAMIAGLSAENPATDVLIRAMVSLVIGQMVGWVAGTIGERVVRDAITQYRDAHPVNHSSTASTPIPGEGQASVSAA